METVCPGNNCIALARWPVSETPMALPPADSAAKRAVAAKAAVSEYFAVVASPTLRSDGAAFNRVNLVVNLDTKGAAIQVYRDQLRRALSQLEMAMSKGEPNVEVAILVPDELTQGRRSGTTGTQTEPGKGKEKTAPKKKEKEASTKKKKKS